VTLKAVVVLVLLLAGVVTAHLFDPDNWPALAIDVMHSLHGSGFAVVAVFVYWLLQKTYPRSFNYLIAAAITMGMGMLAELAQVSGAREAQATDLIEDGLGILGALGLLAAFDPRVNRHLSSRGQVLLKSGAGLALSIVFIPSLWFSYALIEQHRAFPTIVTFERAWERSAFYTPREDQPVSFMPAPDGWIGEGTTIAQFEEAGRWGIFVVLKTVTNWRRYNKLTFVAASTSGSFVFDIGIRERSRRNASKDQAIFYKTFLAGPEPQRYTIGLDEIGSRSVNSPFDLSRVESVVLSAAKPGTGVKILLDDFRLE
jgi:hypothetical protein